MSVDISEKAVELHIECEDCSSEHWYEQNDAMLRALRSALTDTEAKLAEAEKERNGTLELFFGAEDLLSRAIPVLHEAKNKLCQWCSEGEPINDDSDGVKRDGRYHFVRKWGIGLRECKAVPQRKLLEALKTPPASDPQSQLSSAEARGLERAAQSIQDRIDYHDVQSTLAEGADCGGSSAYHDKMSAELGTVLTAIRAITSPMPSQRERELALLRWIKDPFHWYYDDQRYKTPEEVLDAFNAQSKET